MKASSREGTVCRGSMYYLHNYFTSSVEKIEDTVIQYRGLLMNQRFT